MTAYNVVRFRVLPGNEEAFVEAHRKMRPELKGFVNGSLIKTGDQTFCMVGEWRSFKSIVDARPQMKAMLDSVRGMLEDLGGGLGVTDPVSGDVAVRFAVPKAKAKAKAKKTKTKAKSKATKAKPAKSRSAPTAGKRGARKAPAGKRAGTKKR